MSACLWCGAPLAEPPSGPAAVRCAICGAGTTLPTPTDAELGRAYAGWYRPAGGRFQFGLDAFFRRSRSRLARRLDRVAPPGTVLDVGSGAGTLLDALHAAGRDALGLELDSSREDVRAAEIEEVDGDWAAVVFWHSLEHLPHPAAALEHAARLLVPGGVVVIAVPNFDSLQARLFGTRWLALDMPRHLVHLPACALVERIRALGFEPIRVSHWRGGQAAFGWLHGLVGLLPGRPDLYDALRRDEARRLEHGPARRAVALAAGIVFAPLAVVAAALEVAARRGGSIYVEARRG